MKRLGGTTEIVVGSLVAGQDFRVRGRGVGALRRCGESAGRCTLAAMAEWAARAPVLGEGVPRAKREDGADIAQPTAKVGVQSRSDGKTPEETLSQSTRETGIYRKIETERERERRRKRERDRPERERETELR